MLRWGEYFGVARQRVKPPRFQSLFLFVTSQCNSRCRTCFYFDKLNSRDDLRFDEIRRISETAPRFEKLWLSGGEPFLRDELAEIVSLFARNNGIRSVNLPTNGLLPEKVFRQVDSMLERCPQISIDLNFSLDGLANIHDAIRGVPNNFARTTATVEEASRRYRGIRRLRRNIVTVITRENYDEIVHLGLFLMGNVPSDGQYFEVVRGEAPDKFLKQLTRAELSELHRKLMPFHRSYAKALFARLSPAARFFAEMYYLGNLKLHFDLHERCFEKPDPWPMPCTAGSTSLVVDHNGAFRACELRQPLGNLRDFGLDVRAVLLSDAVRDEVRRIPEANCWCTHSCFIQDSSKFSPRVQLFYIPYAWLRQKLHRLPDLPAEEMLRFKAIELS